MISKISVCFFSVVFILSANSAFCQKKDTTITKVKGCQYKVFRYSNDKVEKEGCMLKGKKQGAWKEYDKDGNLQVVYTYVKGLMEGPFVSYYASGKLRSKGTYKKNHIVGLFTTYDEKGNKMVESTWVLDPNGGSVMKEQKFFNNKIKPDGTKETIDGKDCIWIEGKPVPVNG